MFDFEYIQTVYDNTLFATYKASSPLDAEIVCQELATLLGLRTGEEAVPTVDMDCALSFLSLLNINYDHMFIAKKVVTDFDIRYNICFTDSRKSFEVRIVPDKDYKEHYNCFIMRHVLRKVEE